MFHADRALGSKTDTISSGADVHVMTRRTGISSELLLTWGCIAKVCHMEQTCSITKANT